MSNRNQSSKWLKKVELSLKALGKPFGKSEDKLFKEEGIHKLFYNPKTKSFVVLKYLKEEVLLDQQPSLEREKNVGEFSSLVKLPCSFMWLLRTASPSTN